MKLHTEPVKAGAPVFHPNPPGQLIPDEVLKNTPTTEFNDIMLPVFHSITYFLQVTCVCNSLLNIQSKQHFNGEDE